MQGNNLSTTINQGSQQSTKSPQNVVNSSVNNNISTRSIQSDSALGYLNSGQGVQLTPTQLSAINLNSVNTSTTKPSASASSSHHINFSLLMVAIVLFALALTLFWFTSKSPDTK